MEPDNEEEEEDWEVEGGSKRNVEIYCETVGRSNNL
jgi:hypothetical protein